MLRIFEPNGRSNDKTRPWDCDCIFLCGAVPPGKIGFYRVRFRYIEIKVDHAAQNILKKSDNSGYPGDHRIYEARDKLLEIRHKALEFHYPVWMYTGWEAASRIMWRMATLGDQAHLLPSLSMMLHCEALPRRERYMKHCERWQRAEVPSSNSMCVA